MPLLEKLRPMLTRWAVDEPTLIGLSGGVDSVVLFHVMIRLGFARLVVCHLHHGLRGADSDADEALVRELAATHQCELEHRRAPVAALAEENGESLETAGRNARRAFFAEVAAARGINRLFLAHQADDQAETVLMNLLRGAGLNGLGGMREVTAGGPHWQIIRPLLSIPREEILAYARTHSLAWREDATNHSRSHFRNRLRLDVIPALSAALGHDAQPALLRSARLAAEDDHWMTQQADLARLALEHQDGALDAKALSQLPIPLTRRVLRAWLRGHAVPNVGLAVVEAAMAVLAATGQPASLNLPGGRRLRRRGGKLFVDRQESAANRAAHGARDRRSTG